MFESIVETLFESLFESLRWRLVVWLFAGFAIGLAAPVVGQAQTQAQAQLQPPQPSAPDSQTTSTTADEAHATRHWIDVAGRNFEIAPGWSMQQVVTPELAPRPITASLDEQGHLYVADSSGSNAPVQEQLANPTHRILRLVDSDHDGVYDQSTLFADRIMFPEGTLWHQGSLYVAAPPQIWKLTDDNQDGIADRREVWFDGLTLTGCANDLHGPYLGRDGWIYWCKGAFAEQTYQRADGSSWTTRASHIFRRRAEGGEIESVMAGGMDNPVDTIFTPGGERLFTTTFLTHPGNGLRDGVIHAIYGGVYGKDHGVIEGHLRTGELMPELTHLGAAAPAGLALYERESWIPNAAYGDANLMDDSPVAAVACFNLHQLMRVSLKSEGATFSGVADPWVTGESLDFHPTDVIPDADGSLLLVDTGGWYKLCCPTSQFERPEVLGGIYRLIPTGAEIPADPRGLSLDWNQASIETLAKWLDDARPAVRDRAMAELAGKETTAVPMLERIVRGEVPEIISSRSRLTAVWTLCRINGKEARQAIRIALQDDDSLVVQAACHAIAVHRDVDAAASLSQSFLSWALPARRAAAEALGRVGNTEVISSLLEAAKQLDHEPSLEAAQRSTRILEHSLIYAAIEIAQREAAGDAPQNRQAMLEIKQQLESALDQDSASAARWAAITLDQLNWTDRLAELTIPGLDSEDSTRRETAEWILMHRGEWSARLAGRVPEIMETLARDPNQSPPAWLSAFASRTEVAASLAEWIESRLDSQERADQAAAAIVRLNSVRDQSVIEAVSKLLKQCQGESRVLLCDWSVALTDAEAPSEALKGALVTLANDESLSFAERVAASAASPVDFGAIDAELFAAAIEVLKNDDWQTSDRGREALRRAVLSREQQLEIVASLEQLPKVRWDQVLEVIGRHPDLEVGQALVKKLIEIEADRVLAPSQLRERLAPFGDEITSASAVLFVNEATRRAEQATRLEALISEMPAGDVSRGQAIFHQDRTGCIRCHQMGYAGGRTGPDLSRIGQIRAERDLLEAIVFPSASFVRSYESWMAETLDGGQFQGIIVDQDSSSITLEDPSNRKMVLKRSDIADLSQAELSIMPSGFDQQLTVQELADLVAFLKASK